MIQDKLEFNNELKFIKGMITNNEEVERYIDWLKGLQDDLRRAFKKRDSEADLTQP